MKTMLAGILSVLQVHVLLLSFFYIYDNLRNYFIIAYKSSSRAIKVDITNSTDK